MEQSRERRAEAPPDRRKRWRCTFSKNRPARRREIERGLANRADSLGRDAFLFPSCSTCSADIDFIRSRALLDFLFGAGWTSFVLEIGRRCVVHVDSTDRSEVPVPVRARFDLLARGEKRLRRWLPTRAILTIYGSLLSIIEHFTIVFDSYGGVALLEINFYWQCSAQGCK